MGFSVVGWKYSVAIVAYTYANFFVFAKFYEKPLPTPQFLFSRLFRRRGGGTNAVITGETETA